MAGGHEGKMMKRRSIHIGLVLSVMAAAFTGCALVDEDMRDCEADHKINYELRLVTNLTTELQTQLSTQVELKSVAAALQNQLSSIFTDYAHDVDLSFYDVKEDSLRLHHESHIMDANQSSYTLYIPVRQYMHVAVANLEPANPADKEVFLMEDQKCHTARIEQPVNSTQNLINSHSTGVFTARLPMDIKEGIDQEFNVRLYMANCASSIVLDTLGSGIKDIKVLASGFANGLNLADSTYIFNFTPQVQAKEVKVADGQFVCFYAVTFPSKDVTTKTVIDTDDPYVSEVSEDKLWDYTIYTTVSDGSTTETVLSVKVPLRPGQFKLIRAKIQPDGSVTPREPYVGASVTLQWNEQPGWDIDF